jgi:cytochrome c peroxidase
MLFFNPALSGNRDRSCASCHIPARFSADGQPLPRATDNRLLPRHVPDLYLRGAAGWQTMHWDGSLEKLPDGQWRATEGIQLPAHLDEPLAAAVGHALVSPTRMRGAAQSAAEGNDLALIPGGDAWAVGRALARRLAEEPTTASAMQAVYPGLDPADAGLPHIANALAAWIRVGWGTLDSPWDRFLAGNDDALSAEAVRGATLFYGEAGCATCHSGPLLTDQQFHNIGVPQIGPGFDEQGLDFGRYLVTGDPRHYFAFRTPPLRNVALTGPYMHNGVYTSLAEAVRHHHNAAEQLKNFDAGRLPSELHVGKQREPYTTWLLTRSLSPQLRELPPLTDTEMQDILAFLNALTSPSLLEAALGERE